MNIDKSAAGRQRVGKFFPRFEEQEFEPKGITMDPKFAEVFAAQAELVFASDAGPAQTDAIKKRDDLVRHLTGDERNQIRMIAGSLETICGRPRTDD
jgi:ABC-type enterochelin transport system substrate-binding protein